MTLTVRWRPEDEAVSKQFDQYLYDDADAAQRWAIGMQEICDWIDRDLAERVYAEFYSAQKRQV